MNKYVGAIFTIAFAYSMSLCHGILVILMIFQTFSILLYCDLCSVIFVVTALTENSDDG